MATAHASEPQRAARPESHLHNRVLVHNIRALAQVRDRYASERSVEERAADAITSFIGNMRFVYWQAAVVVVWLVVNTGIVPGLAPFDPYPFVMLAMIASVEAIFLSTFVLITQNRQAELAHKRDDLDLQINLLAEHEVTKLIALSESIARHLGIAVDEETEVLKQEVAPETLLSDMERIAQRSDASDEASHD